jgi:hypothetical protein
METETKPIPKPILIKVKRVFGRSLGVADNAAAELFLQLTRTETLSTEHLKIIRDLGHDIVITGTVTETPADILKRELGI